MNKLIITLGLTLAASTGAFADTTALDAYDVPAAQGTAAYAVGTSNDLVSYDRAGKDGSPTFAAPQGGIDYTATASTGGGVSNEQISYDRAGKDGSPNFAR
ncbi:hypothetical protein PZ897_18320 [Hoeflea sp. YIM 152468]|uniref:hypothetical protein n=1 Tax=Hoeflea sp. YIM 152468 TaxID=3031759 RepID=UPI0023D9F7C0|nr:hypothetical protein [Hoeflea sp. YIM 152468]MDF1610142.1 hypothetical protein [Hoeflea sp. YIM 152468]